MEAALAGTFIGKLAEVAGQQLTKEATLVVNFREDFEWLTNKLSDIRGYLEDADVHGRKNEYVKRWLQDVQDIVLDADDIVEECVVHSTRSCLPSYSHPIFRHKMGRRIKDVKHRVASVFERAREMQLFYAASHLQQEASSSGTSQGGDRWRRSSLLESGSPLVAIDSKVEYILSLLDDPAVKVIAVVGMGGIGKTFLLQNVYNRAKQRFEDSIWLSISQAYSVQMLQRDIASHIVPMLQRDITSLRQSHEEQRDIASHEEQVKLKQLVDELKNVVKGYVSEVRAAELISRNIEGRNCLVVLDDVWRASPHDNVIARLGLPSSCKIVVTTRSREVCQSMNATVYQMECLSDEDSWRLFCAYAFPHCEQNRPPRELEEVASQIVKECGNLPLAIKTMSASLANTTLLSEWESKSSQLREVIVAHPTDYIMDILQLSYDSLPPPLKPCFAYFSFFPEDEEIDCEYLISLWIAEGFICHADDQWDIGWTYLYQLFNLCLVEVHELKKEEKAVFPKRYCRLHDLVLDLAIYICKDNKCTFVADRAFPKIPSIQSGSGCHRILLSKKGIHDNLISTTTPPSPQSLRTLSLSHNHIEKIPAKLFTSMKILRVLDLSFTKISTLPNSAGNLKRLRVLNLQGTDISKVPVCVRRLTRLTFLDISECPSLEELPVWIGELKYLHHLITSVKDFPKGVSELVSLRTVGSSLIELSSERKKFLKLKHVASLIKLRELRIKVDADGVKSIGGGILRQLVKVRNLELRSPPSLCPSMAKGIEAMRDLEQLILVNFEVPSLICNFTNLRYLKIREKCSDYSALETIPNLMKLWLCNNCTCKELPKEFGKSGGFPKLRYLHIEDFLCLEEFPKLEEEAMPSLETFVFSGCLVLKKVPEGMERLKSLKECEFKYTGRREIKQRIKEGGEDWNKMKATNPHLAINVISF